MIGSHSRIKCRRQPKVSFVEFLSRGCFTSLSTCRPIQQLRCPFCDLSSFLRGQDMRDYRGPIHGHFEFVAGGCGWGNINSILRSIACCNVSRDPPIMNASAKNINFMYVYIHGHCIQQHTAIAPDFSTHTTPRHQRSSVKPCTVHMDACLCTQEYYRKTIELATSAKVTSNANKWTFNECMSMIMTPKSLRRLFAPKMHQKIVRRNPP